MKSLKFLGGGRVEVEEIPAPSTGGDRALVKVAASAICGSEKKALESGFETNAGHEAAGLLVDPADGFEKGELVGISAVAGCGSCESCEAGIELRCREGLQIQTGMHAEYVAARVKSLRKLPKGTEPEAAVLLSGDGLGVPARGLRHVPAVEGRSTLVLGLGPVGLSHVLVRSTLGEKVLGADPFEARRDLAASLGAAQVFEPSDLKDVAPDLVIEASGAPQSIRFALQVAAPGGTVLQSGECSSVEIDPSSTLIRKELTYIGSWFYASEDYSLMLELAGQGLDPSRLITHRYPASDAQKAFDEFVAGRTGKVILDWS